MRGKLCLIALNNGPNRGQSVVPVIFENPVMLFQISARIQLTTRSYSASSVTQKPATITRDILLERNTRQANSYATEINGGDTVKRTKTPFGPLTLNQSDSMGMS